MNLQNINLLLIVIIAVLVLGLFILTLYYIYKINSNSNTIVSSKNQFKLSLSQALTGAMVPYGNGVPNNNNPNVVDEPTTEVELTDAELDELLQIILAEIGNTNIIESQLLQSLGMYTETVRAFLEALGYIIS
jgi:hypothetical protein